MSFHISPSYDQGLGSRFTETQQKLAHGIRPDDVYKVYTCWEMPACWVIINHREGEIHINMRWFQTQRTGAYISYPVDDSEIPSVFQ